jgi:parallel beta-helix repeat protein
MKESVILMIILMALGSAQPDTLWTRTYGGDGIEDAECVQQTTDGGFIIVGSSTSFGDGNYDIWLIKTDYEGNVLWDNNFGYEGNDYGYYVQQTEDGGFIIVGSKDSFEATSDVWLIKTDSNGAEEWNSVFGGDNDDIGYSVRQTNDTGYIITGTTGSFANGYYDVWLIKTDNEGNEEWNNSLGGNNTDRGNSVIQTNDNGFVVTGYTNYGNGNWDARLFKTDSEGNEEWNKTFNLNDIESGKSVQQTIEGGYIIAGNTYSGLGNYDVWVIKTDNEGNEEWNHTFGGDNHDEGEYIQQTVDGGFIITGGTDSFESISLDVWLIKTDIEGNIEWDQTIGSNGTDIGRCVQQTSDAGYIITGQTESLETGNRDIWLIKVGFETLGCTNPLALNYDPNATVNDGSCEYYDGSIWYVSVDGTDQFGYGSEENPFGTIQYGIDSSSNGDTVLVNPGTYSENINFNGQNIVLGSLFLTTADTSYISQTIIDGSQDGNVVTFESNEDSNAVLCGLTVTNGYAGGWPDGGGGIHCSYSSPKIEYVIITENTSNYIGGGIYCWDSDPLLVNVIISDNNASHYGGGVFLNGTSDPVFENVIISGNSASSYGGGVCNYSNFTLKNVSITGNSATMYGGGIYSQSTSSSLENCILWNDSQPEIYLVSGSLAVTYSNIQGGWSGEGNIDSAPLFVDADNGDYHLQSNSPCIDAGDPSTEFDPDGTIADIGAYYYHQESGCTDPDAINYNPEAVLDDGSCEYYDGPIWYVSVDGADQFGYGSEESPFGSIQYGIDSSSNGDTVLVNPGTYFENINFNGQNITLGSRFLTTADTSYIIQTVIDGNQNGSVVAFINGEDSTAVLSGFKITNGNGNLCTDCGGMSGDRVGGGIFVFDSNPQLNNLLIAQNEHIDLFWGGGIFLWESDVTIENCVITNNEAHSSGGGIAISNSNPTIINSIISDNYSDHNGGGVSIAYNSLPYFENCLIENNIITINGRGAGIYFEESSGTVNNCQILGNQNQGENTAGGGGVALWISEVFLNNSIINGNSTNLEGGGLYLRQSSEIIISNSEISENIALKGGGIYYFESTSLNITNSQILNNDATASHGGGIYAGYSIGGVTIDSTIFAGNHATSKGGGLYLLEPETPHEYESSTIINSTLEGNLSNIGGSMHIENSIVMIENCNISNNSSTFIGGGLSFLKTTAELNNIVLESNHSDGSGAGIQSSYSDIRLNYSQFLNNIAVQEGGAVSAGGSSGSTHTFIINNTIIDSNSSGIQGGGLIFFHPGDIQINNCNITNNIVHESDWGSYGNGGGIVAKIGASPIITNSVISGNSAIEGDLSENQGRGGGLYAEENGHFEIINSTVIDNHANKGGGLYLWYGADANITESNITNNDATWGGGISIDNQYGQSILNLNSTLISNNISNTAGGGLSATGTSGSNVTIHDSKINDNISNDFAGGIFCQPCNLAIHNSEITGNSALEYAGGIELNFTSFVNNPIFNNITVADNSAGAYGGGIFVGNGEVLPEIDISNSIVWSNTPDEIWLNNGYGDCTNVPTLNINYSDVNIDNVFNDCNSLNWSENNISEDPLFNEDYLLYSNSPCIDSGDPDLDNDGIMWENDPNDQDPDGTRMDIGAYYYHQELGCTDPLALNYDPEATIDDDSCVFMLGCTDPLALNYDPDATENDGSCEYFENGDHSLSFDGQDDYVSILADYDPAIIGQSRTISAWVNPLNIPEIIGEEQHRIFHAVAITPNANATYGIAAWGGIGLTTEEPHLFSGVGFSGGDIVGMVSSTTVPIEDHWYHIAMTYDGEYLRLFVNGIEEDSTEFSGFYSTTTDVKALSIGNLITTNADYTFSYFPGNIDEVAVWNNALNQSEIESVMMSSEENQLINSIGHWSLNEGSGDTVFDLSGNQYHGTIYGANWSENVVIHDCTDPLATNYNPDATLDDGSCTYGEPGCNDESAYNYNEDALWNDGSCIYYGDVTQDGSIDVVDVIAMVGYVLGTIQPTPEQIILGDVFTDGLLNIYDIVSLIAIIFENEGLLDLTPLTEATLIQDKNSLTLSKTGSVAGLQIEYEGEFESSLEGWLIEKNENTILMVSLDGSDFSEISYSGDLKIISCAVVDWSLNKIQADVRVIPDQFSFKPAYPNPFNPITVTEYAIPHDAYVVIKIFDVRGQEVAVLVDDLIKEGHHAAVWDASQVSSGVYIIRMTSGDFKAVQKIIFVK